MDISLAEAKSHLSELIERVQEGESVIITKRGKQVAKISSIKDPRKPIDLAALQALTNSTSLQKTGAGEFMRNLRDSDRY